MRTFTALVGTTANTSPSTYGGAFTTLANNNSAGAVAVAKQLVNDQHRLLIQKYFDNERSYAISIIGSSKLTFTTTLTVGATSATLNAAWTQPTCQQFINFSSGDQRMAQFSNGSTSVTWNAGLQNTATTSATTIGLRDYPIPANVSKIKDVTVTVGQLVFTPKPVQTRTEWDYINTLPYISDIPQYFFVWNNTVGIWPIPSTPNNVLSFNYKGRVPDLTFQDYSTGNITTAAVGGYAVTGTATSWSTTGTYPLNTDVTFLNLYLRIDPPFGDGLWYQIQRFNSDTSLTLLSPILNAPNINASTTYTIGQMPVLQEDFVDAMVYGALAIYYTTIVQDPERFRAYDDLYQNRLILMQDYLGTKQVTIDLEEEVYMNNPNLFPYQSS
jgi:hypothetical protein